MIEAEASVEDAELYRDMLKTYVRTPDGLPIEDLQSPVLDELRRQFVAGAANRELRAGLEQMRFNNHDFRNSDFMRLRVLNGLREHKNLNADLRWQAA